MPAENVPTPNIAALYTNTNGGTTADPAIMDGAFQDVVQTINQHASYVNSLVTSGTLSALPPEMKQRQAFINGNFPVCERGTSFTGSGGGTGYHVADRWTLGSTNADYLFYTASRQNFAPGQAEVPNNPKYFMRHAMAAGAAGSAIYEQHIEDVGTFSGQVVTLSFYVKASKPVTLNLALKQNFGSGGSPSVDTNMPEVSVSTIWQKVVRTVTVPSVSGKTVGSSSSLSSRFIWTQMDTFDIDIAEVQLYAGDKDLPFPDRDEGFERLLCRKFLYRLDATDSIFTPFGLGEGVSATQAMIPIIFPVQMRITPTLIFSNPTDFQLRGNVLSALSQDIGSRNGTLLLATASSLAVGDVYRFTANATSSAYLMFDADF